MRPELAVSFQKSTPFTEPCPNQSERWCGWSCSSPSGEAMGKLRVMPAPPGPINGYRKGFGVFRKWYSVNGCPAMETAILPAPEEICTPTKGGCSSLMVAQPVSANATGMATQRENEIAKRKFNKPRHMTPERKPVLQVNDKSALRLRYSLRTQVD